MVDNTQDATHILITNKGLLPCYDGLKEEHFLQLDNNNIFQDMNKHFNKQKFILNRRIKRYILK
ncbi:hypothetical protein MAQA_14489 [Listeria aquatica FSL S10-1188]|nr:hypothetical protein MAQA_14489 [Listeria aquatica FSL S10-1188]